MNIIIILLGFLYCLVAQAGKCRHIGNKAVQCENIASEFEYFTQLESKELGASGYRGYEELFIVKHAFSNFLGKHIFNFSRAGRQFQFLRIKKLTVKIGELTGVRSDAFELFCPYLNDLDLSLNRLSTVPLDALECSGQNSLNLLNLSGNLIEVLSGLDGLQQLKVLDLSNNSLYLIEPNGFENALQLTSIHLQQNYLRQLSEQSFHIFVRRNFSHAIILDLVDNPFECDCSLRWLADWYKQTLRVSSSDSMSAVEGDHPICKMPSRLRGESLRLLSPMELVCEPVITRSTNKITRSKQQTLHANIEVYEGDTVQLTCVVFADPKPRVWWTFKDSVTIGKTLDDQMKGGRYSISNVNLDSFGLNVSTTLIINPIHSSDAGQLRCVAAFYPGLTKIIDQNETSELFQLQVRPRHYRVKASGLWALASLMTFSLVCLIVFVVYCWFRWSKELRSHRRVEKPWKYKDVPLKSDHKYVVSSPVLDLGPPMYGPVQTNQLNENFEVQRLSQIKHLLDDFDISAYDEDYRPLADDLKPSGQSLVNSRDFATTPLLFHHHLSERGHVTSVGETEL